MMLSVGSVASLAANVAVAEPAVTGRVVAAWPSFALIGSYELLMRRKPGEQRARMCSSRPGSGLWRTGLQTARYPSGKMIAAQYGRHEHWGRLVKSAGTVGEFASTAPS